jgi:predicted nucleic acid-binding protein
VSRIIQIARQRTITFYDRAYLQAAEELKAALLTPDKRQAAAGEGIAKIVHLHEAKLRF